MASNANRQSLLNKSKVDKFILIFSLPPALRKIKNNFARNIANVSESSFQFSVYGAVVPELTVPTIQIPYAGSNLYQSSHARLPYPPVSVKFTVDNEFNNYWVIYKWLDLMHNDYTGTYDADELVTQEYENYQTDMTLYGLDEYDNKRIEFIYTKAFPITLGSIDYNYRESGEVESSMTFAYSQLQSKLLNL
jgi:hypothetical protein